MKYLVISLSVACIIPMAFVLCFLSTSLFWFSYLSMVEGSNVMALETFSSAILVCTLQEMIIFRCLQGSEFEKRFIPDTAVIAALRSDERIPVKSSKLQIFRNTSFSIICQSMIGAAYIASANLPNA